MWTLYYLPLYPLILNMGHVLLIDLAKSTSIYLICWTLIRAADGYFCEEHLEIASSKVEVMSIYLNPYSMLKIRIFFSVIGLLQYSLTPPTVA